jgi:hypothetical protein
MSNLIRRVAALAIFFASAGVAQAKPPVWTVANGRGVVVIFGSIHLLPAGLDWRPEPLTSALAKADVLYFELPVDDATFAQAAGLFAARGLLPPKDSLSAHLPSPVNERLRRMAAEMAVPAESLDRMRPWFAEVTLSVLDDLRSGGEVAEGVERQIQALAPANAQRRAFESPRYQIDLLAGTPEADQIASLDETLVEIEDRPKTFQRLVREWMAGDLAGLETDALQPLERTSPTIYRRLITDRNRRWSDVIRGMLDHPGTTVVVVGIGHLLGPKGVPALLRARGLKVAGP